MPVSNGLGPLRMNSASGHPPYRKTKCCRLQITSARNGAHAAHIPIALKLKAYWRAASKYGSLPMVPTTEKVNLDSSWTPKPSSGSAGGCNSRKTLVGPPGFEPGTSCTPKQEISITYRLLSLKTQDLAPCDLDAKWTPKREKLAFGFQLDSTPDWP
jgi:hypothetical protein